MSGMVEVDRAEAEQRIAAACARLPEVAAAYLFGSALGPCRPDSDVDVGAIRRPAAGESDHDRFHAHLALEGLLSSALPALGDHRFHVTVLDEAQPIFAMTVLRNGHLCYVGDGDAHTDFLEHVGQAYRENAPRYQAALGEVLEEPIRRHGD